MKQYRQYVAPVHANKRQSDIPGQTKEQATAAMERAQAKRDRKSANRLSQGTR